MKIKPDFSNVSGLEMFNEDIQEWEDWYLETDDDYYDNIDDYFEDNEDMRMFNDELFRQLKGSI